MQFLERARLYGQAVQVLDEFLGEETRDQVMEHFSQIAGPVQRLGLKDPWDMIARSAQMAGIHSEVTRALHLVYLMRTQRLDELPAWAEQPNEAIWEQLRTWHVLSEFEAKRKKLGM